MAAIYIFYLKSWYNIIMYDTPSFIFNNQKLNNDIVSYTKLSKR